jgi:hypothetical protein
MRLTAKLLGLTLFGGIAVFGAPPAGAFLITQPAAPSAGPDVTLCVDVKGSIGPVVWAFPCNATIAEQWNFVGPELQGLMPNQCLGTKGGRRVDGTLVVLSGCAGGKGQSWGYDNYQIYLLNTNPAQCLDGEAGELQQLSIHKCSASAPSQRWTLH